MVQYHKLFTVVIVAFFLVSTVSAVFFVSEVKAANPLTPNLPNSCIADDYLLWQNWNGDPANGWGVSSVLNTLTTWHCTGARLLFTFSDCPGAGDPNQGPASTLVYSKLDSTLAYLDSVGVKAILCDWGANPGNWYGSTAWVNDWVALATHYAGDTRIKAFELTNEPYPYLLSTSGPTGGINPDGNGYYMHPFDVAMKYCIDQIRGADSSRTIMYPIVVDFVSPVSSYTPSTINSWYNDLVSVGVIAQGNIIWDITHPYYFQDNSMDPYPNCGPTGAATWYYTYEILPQVAKFGAVNCWLGEMFCWQQGGWNGQINIVYNDQVTFVKTMINYCTGIGMGFQLLEFIEYPYGGLTNAITQSDYYTYIHNGVPTPSPTPTPILPTLPTLHGSDDISATWTTNNGQYASYSAWSSAINTYIATIKTNGGNCLDILINAGAPSGSNAGFSSSASWASTVTVPGYTYWQLVVALSSKLHAQGMYLGIQPTYSTASDFVSLVSTPALVTSYCTQYATMVTAFNPDFCNIYSEPSDATGNLNPVSSTLMNQYVNFCVNVAGNLTTAKSSIVLGVMGCPWWDGRSIFHDGNGYFTSGQSIFNFLPIGTIFMTHINYGDGAQTLGGYWNEYYTGSLSQAKIDYYEAMLTYYGVIDCNTIGVKMMFEAAGGYQSNPNILQFLTDTCTYAYSHDISWITSGTIASYVGNIMYPWAFYTSSTPTATTLNTYGQTMFSTLLPPPSPTPYPTPDPSGTPYPTSAPSGNSFLITQQPFNLNFNTGDSFAVQSLNPSSTITFTITSGTLNGTGSVNATNKGGVFQILPTTSGTMIVTTTGVTTSVFIEGQYANGIPYNFFPGDPVVTWGYGYTPIIVTGNGIQYYFRSDTYKTLGVTGYGFDSDYTNTATSINESYSGTNPVNYAFQVYLYSTPTTYSLLTPSSLPTITVSGNYSGSQSVNYNMPLTSVTLGYQALQINVLEQSGSGDWITVANFVSPVLHYIR